MCDKGSDCSNTEQLPLNIWSVDENLNTHEDFIAFYKVHKNKSNTTAAGIKDIILRFKLSFEFC